MRAGRLHIDLFFLRRRSNQSGEVQQKGIKQSLHNICNLSLWTDLLTAEYPENGGLISVRSRKAGRSGEFTPRTFSATSVQRLLDFCLVLRVINEVFVRGPRECLANLKYRMEFPHIAVKSTQCRVLI